MLREFLEGAKRMGKVANTFREKLLNLPKAEEDEEIPLLDLIYIIPTRKKHKYSGYKMFVVVGYNKQLNYEKILTDCADVITIGDLFRLNQYCEIEMPEYNVFCFYHNDRKFKVECRCDTFQFVVVGDKK